MCQTLNTNHLNINYSPLNKTTMSFGGSASAMNKTISQNRGLVKRVSAFERLKEQGVYSKSNKVYRFKKATANQLARIRENMKDQNRINLVLRMTLLMLITGAVGYLLYLSLNSTTIL